MTNNFHSLLPMQEKIKVPDKIEHFNFQGKGSP